MSLALEKFSPSMCVGVVQAFICLLLISAIPVIANSRPSSGAGTGALAFAFLLSVWQFLFSLPLFLIEAKQGRNGLFDRQISRRTKGKLFLAIIGTGMMFAISTFLYVLSAEKAGAIGTALALQAYPLFAILWESLFLKRRKSGLELLFTGLLIVALVYLATDGTFMPGSLSHWFVVALAIPLIWSVAHIILRELMGKTSFTPAQITTLRSATATLFLLGILFVTGDVQLLGEAFSHGALQQSAALLGGVYYVELLVWFYAVRHIDVSLASSITVPSPAVTMILAMIFLGDTIQPFQIGAMIAIMLSLYGLIYAGSKR